MRIGHLRLVAVSRGHHPLGIDEGATTEVVAHVQGHLVGDGILLAGVATDDLVIVVSRESNLNGDRKGEANSADVGGWSPEPRGWICGLEVLNKHRDSRSAGGKHYIPDRCHSTELP